jgi:hypothetical protein
MERKIGWTTLVVISFIVFSVAQEPAARAQEAQDADACSKATVAGEWGFTTNGTVVGIGPRSSLGIITFDATGSLISGKATASLNGGVTDETFSGTYTVSPDCTGTLAFEVFDLSGTKILTATVGTVFDDDVRELRAIFTSVLLPNGTPLATVITADGRKLFK